MAEERVGNRELEVFLAELRALRGRAGQPSLRAMARTAHYSHTALSGVVSGGHLPSLALTLAFVRACRGDEDEWRRRWHDVHRCMAQPHDAEADGGVVSPGPWYRRGRRWLIAFGAAGVAAMSAAFAVTMPPGTAGPVKAMFPARQLTTVVAGNSCPERPDPGDHPLVPCDDDRFIADVTIPDGATVRAGHRFVKTWEIQNTGRVAWHGRYLTREGLVTGPGLCDSAPQVAIPDTLPGQEVQISVTFTAPSLPGSCRADWKMTDGGGRLYFPDRDGLYMIVNVAG